MPRLPPSLFWKARRISPQGPVILPACRDLSTVATELRWIREHIDANRSRIPDFWRFWKLCEKRGRGVPLQYVLGTQPFGDLEIRCRPGVLIPRPETEAYTVYLARELTKQWRQHSAEPPQKLRVLDLCTGTGCIALQLYTQLGRSFPTTSLEVLGVDISPTAVSLAQKNLAYNARLKLLALPPPSSSPPEPPVRFSLTDLFSRDLLDSLRNARPGWDVMVSNPPYISRRGFALNTARAVRNWEPRTALVPGAQVGAEYIALGCRPEDVFYARLLDIAAILKPSSILLEVAGMEQAIRVARMAKSSLLRHASLLETYDLVEIWRDNPGTEVESLELGGENMMIRGSGQGRSVYIASNPGPKSQNGELSQSP